MSTRTFIGFVTAFLFGAALSSCGGDGSTTVTSQFGQVNVTMADDAADELDRFEVDVTAIDLVKRNGARVHTLPLTTRIDFADLVEVAELVNAASVPSGVYVEAEVTLDFSTAAVHIAGAAANATVLGEDGAPLTGTVVVGVMLDDSRRLVVAPGLPRIMTLDFDLDASTTVDAAANTVQLSPVLTADIDLQRPHVHRVRGPLEAVDTGADTFDVAVRPFRALVSEFGRLRVSTTSSTHFEVNESCFTGHAGIEALASLPALAAVVATGSFEVASGRFVASEVLAGSSVPGGTLDVVEGLVRARDGNTLWVIGAQLDRSNGSVTFNAEVVVVLDPSRTIVTKQLSMDPQSTDAVSVGQRVIAFGELDGGPGSFVMSSTSRLRMLRTRVLGTVKAASGGVLTLDLQRIGHRKPDVFDFSGTGPAGSAADPHNYEVDVEGITLAGVGPGTPARVFGFAAPFGSAPPDFEAVTVVDVSDVGAVLAVAWLPGSDVQFTLQREMLDLDLSDSPLVHHVERAGTLTDLSSLPAAAVVPETAHGFFVIAEERMVTVYGRFDRFIAALESRLAAGKTARRLVATGHFDDGSGELAARAVTVLLR